MKSILYLIFYFSINASAGERTTHGGDPHAAEFASLASKIGNWMRLVGGFDFAEDFRRQVWAYEDNMSQDDEEKLVRSVKDKPLDSDGNPQDAVFNSDRSIRFHKSTWEQMTPKRKVTLVSMEVLGVISVKNRYGIAENRIAPHYRAILKQKVTAHHGIEFDDGLSFIGHIKDDPAVVKFVKKVLRSRGKQVPFQFLLKNVSCQSKFKHRDGSGNGLPVFTCEGRYKLGRKAEKSFAFQGNGARRMFTEMLEWQLPLLRFKTYLWLELKGMNCQWADADDLGRELGCAMEF